MVDVISPGPMGNGETAGGPPVDIGNSTPAPTSSPAAPPAAPPAPELKVTPPAEPAAPPPPKPPAISPKETPAAPPKSIAETPQTDETPPPAPATWPEDWRKLLAGDDKKALARAERFNSPSDVFNAYRALESRLSSGEYKRTLPNNHTEDELKEYRKSNGVPDDPKDYKTDLGNGFVWGEADKPFLDDFSKFAHDRNMPQDMMKSALEWYASSQQAVADEKAIRDERERITGTDALRANWGGEYQKNLNASRNLFEGKADHLWSVIMGARDNEGKLLGNRPDVLEFTAGLSKELNPYSTLVPDSTGSAVKTAEGRKAEIEALMGNKRSSYWRGETAAPMQKEYRDIIEMIERGKTRAA